MGVKNLPTARLYRRHIAFTIRPGQKPPDVNIHGQVNPGEGQMRTTPLIALAFILMFKEANHLGNPLLR